MNPNEGAGIWLPGGGTVLEGPRELPPGPRLFVNRTAERARLRVLEEPDPVRMRPLLVVLSGLGGIGKTALVLHVTGLVQRLYPDGTLYVDLSLHRHRGKVDLGEVVAGLLRSLGLDDGDIPASMDERRRRYMSVTARRKLLVVVDNVVTPAEAERLLPASADSAVVITSHQQLPELDGDLMLALAGLTPQDGREILAEFCPEERLAADPQATAQLIEACGGLPIALRLVGGYLRKHPTRELSRVVERLQAEFRREQARDGRGSGSLFDAVAKTAYEDLSEGAAETYRLLSVHPGTRFGAGDVAALGDLDEFDAEDHLAELCQANLVVEHGDRFRFASLVAGHAAACARSQSTEWHRDALLRLVTARLAVAQSADHETGPRLRLAAPTGNRTPFPSRRQALDWLDAERVTLVALQRAAATLNRPDLVWRFAEALWPMFMARRGQADWRESSILGVDAAEALGDRVVEARMRCQYGRCLLEYGDPAEAETQIRAAIELLATGGHPQLLASAWEFLGRVHAREQRHRDALAAYDTSLELLEGQAAPDQRAVALVHHFIGQARLAEGDLEAAVREFGAAEQGFATVGDTLSLGKVAADQAAVRHRLGELPAATEAFETAISELAAVGATSYLAEAHLGMAHVAHDNGDRALARTHLEASRQLFERVGSPRADEVTARLDALDGSADGDLDDGGTDVGEH